MLIVMRLQSFPELLMLTGGISLLWKTDSIVVHVFIICA